MIVLGIDIGLTGAVAAVHPNGTASVHDIPTVADGGKGRRICGRGLLLLLRELVAADRAALVLFEDVRARPMGNGSGHGNTMHSQGSLMRSRGIVEAAIDIARFDVCIVQPATWKRWHGLLKTEKGASLDLARSLYPALAGDLKRKKDHNRAESLLIAHYGKEDHA